MKIRSKTLNWLMAATIVVLCRLLFRTLRIQYLLADPESNPYTYQGSKAFIYSAWHDSVAVPMFGGPHWRTVALVSKHQDGSCLATGLKMIGVGLVRGSSSRNGAGALRELIQLPPNLHVVMTPDGPRGPRRQIKPGMVFLASRSGRAIVPTAYASNRCWRIPGSWTDLEIPKPFSIVYAVTGWPIYIPRDAGREELARAEAAVQAEMVRLTVIAERLAKGKRLSAQDRAEVLAEIRNLDAASQSQAA